MKICWLSAGVSSFIAGYLVRDTVDKFIYIDIENQHPDSIRFIKDCERAINKPVEILKSNYGNIQNVIRQFRFISSPHGAKCTEILKKRVRKEWEAENPGRHIYVWGFDVNEKNRANRLIDAMPQVDHEFPLIDKFLSKEDAHGICNQLGIKRPVMYDLGYNNNNCIGCVKGGMGYWNRIRIDFPDVFYGMAKLEREIGHSCLNGIFLDELEPTRGKMTDEIMEECSLFCMLNI